MRVPITRIDTSLPLPEYHTSGAVAFDFYARVEKIIPTKTIVKIPGNFIIKTPPGYALIIAARSSLFEKKGIILTNGIGIIDNDYCGPEDEILLSVYNMREHPIKVAKGERIAQGMFVATGKAKWVDTDSGDKDKKLKLRRKSRGGFGSTG